jgi:hypothetical protein
MNPLCSVLIPSRARPEQLKETIASIRDAAQDADAYEILVRIDDDDAASAGLPEDLRIYGNVKVMVGSRCEGYASLNKVFYRELEEIASGSWCWIMNDDAVVIGEDWDSKLAAVPLTGYIVQPEIEQLNASVYEHNECTGFPCYPRKCWKQLGMLEYPNPCDSTLPPFLFERGWKTWFLSGITVHHRRASEADQERHRKM